MMNLRALFAVRLVLRAILRKPDRVINGDYLSRWYLIPRNPVLNVYLHRFGGDDDPRALHDHPWVSLSWCIAGQMRETYQTHPHPNGLERTRTIIPGDWVWRGARFAHRLELDTTVAWTVFITGPRIRSWGFWCPQGWRHWRDFADETGDGIGRGCD